MKIKCPIIATMVLLCMLGSSVALATNPSPFVPDASDLVDPIGHYSTPLTLLNVQLKALPTSIDNPYTIADVNTDLDPYDSFVPEIKVHFQTDVDYPDDGYPDNAKLRMRGSSSRLGAQKSYRVKLNKSTTDKPIPAWRGERTLQLNKHPWDLTRVRNKLAFDLFTEIPHLNSLRTQFIHMTFDDDANPATPDVDYGLFTHVEKMGLEYLTNRGWSEISNIYKAADFSFRSDPRLALKADNTPLNTTDFERVLELENGTNHGALLQMISAIDSDSNDFNTEFGNYFNRNNYLTWLAVNILMGNRDTRNQNFALLQPYGATRFYLLPWDYDGAFGFESQPDIAAVGTLYADWQLGLSNYWGIPLHQRFLQQPGNLAALEAAVEELRSLYLTSDRIQSKIDSYRPLVEALVKSDPDLANLPTLSSGETARQQEWSGEYQRLTSAIDDNYNKFRQRLEKPMPFWQAAEAVDGKLILTWDRSVDLQNDTVTYQVTIASQPDFEPGSVILHQAGVTGTRLELNLLPNGIYYIKVVAADSKGYTQEAFDRTDAGGRTYFGTIRYTSGFLAKNITTSTSYVYLADALSSAASGNEIRVLQTLMEGPFTLISDTLLSGGWNSAFSGKNGMPTVLNGGLTIQSGASTASALEVMGQLIIKIGSLKVDGVTVRQ